MESYAAFIWPAYGLTLFVLVAIWVMSLRRFNQLSEILRRLESEDSQD